MQYLVKTVDGKTILLDAKNEVEAKKQVQGKIEKVEKFMGFKTLPPKLNRGDRKHK
ncbi:hypothetical protein [Salirhabdus salicampi]|uniref:hypothetical protein n=1 Tax=Salirhabdus salicampi TaxID=476102 RepID=UPI0020C4D8AD|nr:hypothetical protein [Salirhabdus salicampi]MCP8616381.1 hypothetical protein [Salirhabdus salicampi]